MNSEDLKFSVYEIMSIIGMAQCVMILVYMALRSGSFKRAVIPFFFFLVLGSAFFFDLSERFISDAVPAYQIINWSLWYSIPIISFLLITQIAKITEVPSKYHFLVLLLLPLVFGISHIGYFSSEECTASNIIYTCSEYIEWYKILMMIAGLLSLLAVWINRMVLDGLYNDKYHGKDRYWLILALIFANIILLILELVSSLSSIYITSEDAVFARTVLGLAVSYIASTSLFRIYPQAVLVNDSGQYDIKEKLGDDELKIAKKIEQLLNLEKVYHEPSYGRTDLAQELQVQESVVSRVIKIYFDKNLPQLLNEYRIEDAKMLLAETDAPIKIIAEESGFNSIASFNRVFKDITGKSPGEYRNAQESQ